MKKRGTIGIQMRGSSDCHIHNSEFSGLGTALDIEGSDRIQVTSSRFRENQIDVNVEGGAGHSFRDNIFEGARPSSQQEALAAIRKRLGLDDKMPDREILTSLREVLGVDDEKGKQQATTKSTLGKWLIEHGSDVNTAANTLVTLAAAVAQWLK